VRENKKNCFHVDTFREDFPIAPSAESSINEPAIRTLALFGQVNDVVDFLSYALSAAIRKMFGTKGVNSFYSLRSLSRDHANFSMVGIFHLVLQLLVLDTSNISYDRGGWIVGVLLRELSPEISADSEGLFADGASEGCR
jgi:hypothetical protein